MRIEVGSLFARHNQGFVELWVMGEDGVRPARPSDFQLDAKEILRSGEPRDEAAPADQSDPLALAAHLRSEAKRLAPDVTVADAACCFMILDVVGARAAGLPALLAALLEKKP